MVLTTQNNIITNVLIKYSDILRAANIGTTLVLSLSANSIAPSWVSREFIAVLELQEDDILHLNDLKKKHTEVLNTDLIVICRQTIIASVYITKLNIR
jgi:hypothetical protein